MRVLVVTDEHPWPSRSGYRQRLDQVVRSLSADAQVDLLVVVGRDDRSAATPPSDVTLGRHDTVVAGPRSEPRVRRIAGWIVSGQPRGIGWRDWTDARALLADRLAASYDAVWFSHVNSYLALGDLVAAPHVVDLDNLVSFLLRHRRRMLWHSRRGSWLDRVTVAAEVILVAVDGRRWRRLERRIADRVAAVVVCSTLDRERLGRPNVRVVQNGYELRGPGRPEPRPGHRAGPVLLTVGLLTYEPNLDAARFLAHEVLPRVQAALPDAQFRVVGRFGDESQVAALRALHGVTVVGEVPDISVELRAADIAVVPVRFGGGTRIKILEAFANRLPVVTTTVGAEGLDAVDGEHVLVADDASAFAAACVRLHRDAQLRADLEAAGFALWDDRYRWSSIAPVITAVVREAAGT